MFCFSFDVTSSWDFLSMYFLEDEQLARHLQNQFNANQGFKFHNEFKEKENQNPVDSHLEFIDPTPSIHDLFVKFDKKFFWNALGRVEVTWSNRMTKCAGMCSFSPTHQICKISLSAPLLSLRPRKDLVETLLHEMIHAYLFVTNNFRDREDHGPEFHKHMYRINKEAGTKITVYHTFHDEVEYYQRHIWRCNGPCQNKKPYFGFVRRAINRAPGPNDTWWNDHKRDCNGTFIKISEPEKVKKVGKKAKELSAKKLKDIREFFNSKKSPEFNVLKKANVMTLADLKNDKPAGGLKTNSNTGTVVVTNTKKNPKSNNAQEIGKSKQNTPKGDKNAQRKDSENSKTKKESDDKDIREFVRNVWAKKFPSKTETPDPETSKKLKIQCPVCDEGFCEEEINTHVDECLQNATEKEEKQPQPKGKSRAQDNKELKQCLVCGKQILQSELNEHLENCFNCNFTIDEENDSESEVQCQSIPCPCCYKWFLENEMNSHIDDCLTLISLKEEILAS